MDKEESQCENLDTWGRGYTCGTLFDCCDCGYSGDEPGCGCRYCFSCNACENCLGDDDE